MTVPILVVDDDPNSLDIARTYLESRGYTVATALDGKEALAKNKELRAVIRGTSCATATGALTAA